MHAPTPAPHPRRVPPLLARRAPKGRARWCRGEPRYPAGGEEDFDGVAEIWLDRADDYLDRWTDGAGLEAVRAFLDDEANFVDWTRSVFFLGEEETVIG